MQIEEFNQYVKDHIKEYLPPEYETAKVSIQEVTKSNDRMLSGLTILREGENFSPTVYLEPFAEQVALLGRYPARDYKDPDRSPCTCTGEHFHFYGLC